MLKRRKYITPKPHTHVDIYPHIPYTPFFHLVFFRFPDSRFCKHIVLQALIPLIFIFPAHSQIFHLHRMVCFLYLRIFPEYRSFSVWGDIFYSCIFFIAITSLFDSGLYYSALSFCESFSCQEYGS